jgi:hypothetical protein
VQQAGIRLAQCDAARPLVHITSGTESPTLKRYAAMVEAAERAVQRAVTVLAGGDPGPETEAFSPSPAAAAAASPPPSAAAARAGVAGAAASPFAGGVSRLRLGGAATPSAASPAQRAPPATPVSSALKSTLAGQLEDLSVSVDALLFSSLSRTASAGGFATSRIGRDATPPGGARGTGADTPTLPVPRSSSSSSGSSPQRSGVPPLSPSPSPAPRADWLQHAAVSDSLLVASPAAAASSSSAALRPSYSNASSSRRNRIRTEQVREACVGGR